MLGIISSRRLSDAFFLGVLRVKRQILSSMEITIQMPKGIDEYHVSSSDCF